jgi:tRNA nucleotidyltransferase/poly(A) polymerase
MRLDLAISQEIYLASIGYSTEEIKAATNRAIGQAERLAKRLPADMRERAFEEFLAQELAECQSWIDSYRRGALQSEQQTKRYERGLKQAGAKPGPQTVKRYRQAAIKKQGI